MNSNFDSAESPPPVTPEFNSEQQLPLLLARSQAIVDSLPDYLHQIASQALFTIRRPKDGENIHLPIADSTKEQLQLVMAKDRSFFAHAKASGYFFKADSKKTQLISEHFGKKIGDGYIASNYELWLKVAAKLDCNVLLGVYSGDENTGLLVPRNNAVLTGQILAQTIEQVEQEYYQENNKFFAPITDYLKSKQDERGQPLVPGVTYKYIAAADAKIARRYAHDKNGKSIPQQHRISTIMAGIIDATEHYDVNMREDNRSLLDELEENSKKPRTTHHYDEGETGSAFTDWPPSINKLFEETKAKIMGGAKVLSADIRDRIDQLSAYCDLAVYEPVFPRSLGVKRLEWLVPSIRESHNQGKRVYLARFADIRLKSVNDESHLMGDYHMTATVRIIQNALQKAGIDPHTDFSYHQHFGSLALEIDCDPSDLERWDKINEVLSDLNTLNVNNNVKELRYLRGINPYRASPLVATTTTLDGKPIEITKDMVIDDEKLWDFVDGRLKPEHNKNETLFAYNLPSLAIPLLHAAIDNLTIALDPHVPNLEDPKYEQSLQLLRVIKMFIEAYDKYIEKRPERAAYVSEYYLQQARRVG